MIYHIRTKKTSLVQPNIYRDRRKVPVGAKTVCGEASGVYDINYHEKPHDYSIEIARDVPFIVSILKNEAQTAYNLGDFFEAFLCMTRAVTELEKPLTESRFLQVCPICKALKKIYDTEKIKIV